MSAVVFALTAHQVHAQSGTVYNNYGADTLLPIPCTGFSSPGAAMSCAMAANLVNPAYYIFSAPSLTPGYTNLYQETCSPTPAGVAAGHSACGAYYAEASACSGAQCGMKDVGNCSSCAGDPIAMAIGSKFLEERDFVASNAGPLRFVRFYNTSSVGAFASSLSPGWMHNYAMTVNTLSATSVLMTRADGKTFTFNLIGSIWTPDADVSDRLVQLTSGSTVTGWQYTNASDDSLETYDAHGNLSSIVYREGMSVNLAYATGSSAPIFPAQLLSVTDSFGLQLTFKYSFNPDKVTMTDPKGEVYTYTIGSMVQLASVTYPDSTYKSYLYNEAAYTGGQSIRLR